MKILHILEDYSIKSGGLRTVVKNLHEKLIKENNKSFIISSFKEMEDEIYHIYNKNIWLYSSEWNATLFRIWKEQKIEFFHIHGVWMYPQYIAAKFAIKNNIPFVLSPHGMYQPQTWIKSTLKKKIYFHLLTKSLFSKASIIHTITEEETKTIKELFSKNKTVEIPNLINDIEYLEKASDFSNKYVLFVGRLAEIKGIDLLIKAYGEINPEGFKLKIAGEINDYKEKLQLLVNSLNIQDKVEFLGLISGNKKNRIFNNAFVLVAPSYSEVIGMVNLEAAILKTPVITTHQTGLKKQWSENGGFLINPSKEELVNILKDVFKMSIYERNLKGDMLYKFVKKEYSWESKYKDWHCLYQQLK